MFLIQGQLSKDEQKRIVKDLAKDGRLIELSGPAAVAAQQWLDHQKADCK
jgi:hypothetical protein